MAPPASTAALPPTKVWMSGVIVASAIDTPTATPPAATPKASASASASDWPVSVTPPVTLTSLPVPIDASMFGVIFARASLPEPAPMPTEIISSLVVTSTSLVAVIARSCTLWPTALPTCTSPPRYALVEPSAVARPTEAPAATPPMAPPMAWALRSWIVVAWMTTSSAWVMSASLPTCALTEVVSSTSATCASSPTRPSAPA